MTGIYNQARVVTSTLPPTSIRAKVAWPGGLGNLKLISFIVPSLIYTSH